MIADAGAIEEKRKKVKRKKGAKDKHPVVKLTDTAIGNRKLSDLLNEEPSADNSADEDYGAKKKKKPKKCCNKRQKKNSGSDTSIITSHGGNMNVQLDTVDFLHGVVKVSSFDRSALHPIFFT